MLILLTIFTLGMRIQDSPECIEVNGIECNTNKMKLNISKANGTPKPL